jgi:hypothetical protein
VVWPMGVDARGLVDDQQMLVCEENQSVAQPGGQPSRRPPKT